MSRRLLVVSYHFGPSGPVGGLRWWGLGKHLARSGWEVHVVSAGGAVHDGVEPVQLPAGMRHVPLPPTRTLGRRYRDFRRRAAGLGGGASSGFLAVAGGAEAAAASTDGGGGSQEPSEEAHADAPLPPGLEDTPPPPPRGIAALRGELAALAVFPDDGRGWVLRAALRARRLIREIQPTALVSSGPPHSAHIAAWLATRGTGVRWLLDLRDPWGERDHSSPNVSTAVRRSRWLRESMVRLESRTIRSSDGFITTTPELRDELQARYSGATGYCLTNGVDAECLPALGGDRLPGFGVAHVGTLYARRDPRPLLRAFRLFLDREPEALEDGTRLRFAGAIDGPYRRMLDEAIARLELGEHVEILGVLPRGDALELLARSSLAVVMTRRQDRQIPAKLYEPVALGVPTLVLAAEATATDLAAQRLGLAVADPDDVEAIARRLAEARSGGRPQAPAALARAIDYATLAGDAERILLHDPADPPPPPPWWTTR